MVNAQADEQRAVACKTNHIEINLDMVRPQRVPIRRPAPATTVNTIHKEKNMTERTIYGQIFIEVDGADCTDCDLEFMSSKCRAVRCCPADRSDGRAVVYKRKPDPQINTNPSLL